MQCGKRILLPVISLHLKHPTQDYREVFSMSSDKAIDDNIRLNDVLPVMEVDPQRVLMFYDYSHFPKRVNYVYSANIRVIPESIPQIGSVHSCQNYIFVIINATSHDNKF